MQKKVIITVLLIGAFVYGLGLGTHISMGDASHYIILARALTSGQGYTDICFPKSSPHNTYPPLFPLLLCPLLLVFGENILAFKIFSVIAMLLAGVLFFFLLKDEEPFLRNWAGALFVLSPIVVMYSGMVLSEALYLSLSFAAILFLEKYKTQQKLWNKYLILSIVFMGACFYTRTIGIALGIGAVCFFLYIKQFKKAALLLAGFSLVIAPWIIRDVSIGSIYVGFFLKGPGPTSLDIFSLLKRMAGNTVIYTAKVMADTFFFPFAGEITRLNPFFIFKAGLSSLLSLAVASGFIATLRRKIKLVHCYTLTVFLICLAWPVHEARFLLPVYPLLIVFFLRAINYAAKKRRIVFIAAAMFLLTAQVYGDALIIHKNRHMPYNKEEQGYLAALGWMKGAVSRESILMCRKPRIAYYLSGMRAMFYPYTEDQAAFLAAVKQNNIDFIIYDSLGERREALGMWHAKKFVKPVVEAHPNIFTLVYETKDKTAAAYKINKERL